MFTFSSLLPELTPRMYMGNLHFRKLVRKSLFPKIEVSAPVSNIMSLSDNFEGDTADTTNSICPTVEKLNLVSSSSGSR